MFGQQMCVECRLIGIDLVEQHPIVLTLGLQNIKLQAPWLGSDGRIRICVNEAPEFRSRTLFEVEIDNDHKKHTPDPVQAALCLCCYAAFS